MINLDAFEKIARSAGRLLALPARSIQALPPPVQAADTGEHPFDLRNVHPDIPPRVLALFDDAYYSEATYEACKYLDKLVGKIIKSGKYGETLMNEAFSNENGKDPIIRLNGGIEVSERDEQKGYRYLFAGTIVAIRNPRGHELSHPDSVEDCLDHLGLVSLLLRRLNSAGINTILSSYR